MFLFDKVHILRHCGTAEWSDRAGCLSIRFLLSVSISVGTFNKLSWQYDFGLFYLYM